MGKIIFSIRVPAFFPRAVAVRGTPHPGKRRISALVAAGNIGHGASAPAFPPTKCDSVFQHDFKCPISFINILGAIVVAVFVVVVVFNSLRP